MIRKMSAADADAVAHIWLNENLRAHEFIQESYWLDNFMPVRAALERAEVYVFELGGGEIGGFIGLTGNYVAGIFVREDRQGRGEGRDLLTYVKNLRDHLELSVYAKNIRAMRFYEREGFSVVDGATDENTGEFEYLLAWDK
jgi:putative acetyltransferase